MWDASHLAMILCALRHWKQVSMPPITQYLRHPLPRANHIPPRTKTTRLTAKNPAHLLFGEFNPNPIWVKTHTSHFVQNPNNNARFGLL